MIRPLRVVRGFGFILACILSTVLPSQAQERLCDPSFEDCYTPLVKAVQAETAGIDFAFYGIELPGLEDAIIRGNQAGVAVRITVEPRANEKFPGYQAILDKFQAAGIPMRYKLTDGIVHVRMMLLAGQNTIVFSISNFDDLNLRTYDT